MRGAVVVGVEGTVSSEDAVRWAAEQASARGVELVVVHAVGEPRPGFAPEWDPATNRELHRMLERVTADVRDEYTWLKVTAEVELDTPARCLTTHSATAQLVVVGTRRRSPLQRAFSGSLAYQVVAGSTGSVAVVPPGSLDVGAARVVVGVDGSPQAAAALHVAAVEADRTGAALRVVHAWQGPRVLWDVRVPPDLGSAQQVRENAVLDEAVATVRESFPDLAVEPVLVEGHPGQVLLDEAEHARLLVVGSRGLHGVARMLLGSTSHAAVLHARCPVLVVHG